MSNLLSQINPLLQAPAEIASRTNFFTGNSFDSVSGSDARNEMAVTSLLSKVAPGTVDFSSGYVTKADGTKKFQATSNPVINTLLDALPTARAAALVSKFERPDLSVGQKVGGLFAGVNETTVNGEQSASAQDYYSAHDMVEQGLQTLLRMGYVKQKSDNRYVVNMAFSSGNDAVDSKMRVQALSLINAQSNPQQYVNGLK
jgi:hypothetical protein